MLAGLVAELSDLVGCGFWFEQGVVNHRRDAPAGWDGAQPGTDPSSTSRDHGTHAVEAHLHT